MAVHYQLSLDEPQTHLVKVKLLFQSPTDELELYLPNWSPGAYQIKDHIRHLQELKAQSTAGEELNLEQSGKSSFRNTRKTFSLLQSMSMSNTLRSLSFRSVHLS